MSSPSRHHSIFPRPPRPTSHGGPRMATAPRTRPLGHVGRVGPCAAPPPAESDVAYVALPPRAPSSDAFPRPNTGQRGARAADGHVLVQWCWRRPAAPAWCAFGSGQESSVMGSWRAGRSRQSGCCSISDGTVARVGICCYWKRHEMEGPTDLGEWSLDSILTWLIV